MEYMVIIMRTMTPPQRMTLPYHAATVVITLENAVCVGKASLQTQTYCRLLFWQPEMRSLAKIRQKWFNHITVMLENQVWLIKMDQSKLEKGII